MTIEEKILQLKRKQNNYVGEWEEYDRLEEIIEELSS